MMHTGDRKDLYEPEVWNQLFTITLQAKGIK